MNRIFISAIHKSSGKTTLSIGLCAALRERGLHVQPFKKGPDYIDPMWLGRAAGHGCYNLDFHTMSEGEICREFGARVHKADIGLIEGNKGLYDGLDLEGSNSNAALARLLGVPVVLVLDTRGMTRGVAPILLGHQAFDPHLQIAGVIFNQVGGSRHEGKLRRIVEHYTDIPVIGAVHRDPALDIDERHLGLIPSNEAPAVDDKIRTLARAVHDQVDLDRLLEVAAGAGPLPCSEQPAVPVPCSGARVRIGIARDAAFGFYYPSDLDAFARCGAELVPFDALHDIHLPEVDGLFIGGGFPETAAADLSANLHLRREIRAAIQAGLPAYAECGGLMYLCRNLVWGEQRHAMVGSIPADVEMHSRPQGRGYVMLEETPHHPWPRLGMEPPTIHAHEFHYSALQGPPEGLPNAYTMKRGMGIDGAHDGIIYRNLLANYSHLRHTDHYPWVARFVEFVRRCTHETELTTLEPEDEQP
ncbi:MAG: cobyrinate a,c-diamide synthase [Gammaproteobacteria bacterium]|nr:MAG: cobyrinate a,c-diamide synthase [Gammaproteobacteria bacterium]